MQQPTHTAAESRTSYFPGSSLPIADPSKYDARLHNPAYQPSRIGAHTLGQVRGISPVEARVRLLGHEAAHTIQQTHAAR